jgi:hypothetical protein
LLSLRNESIHAYVIQGFIPSEKDLWEQMNRFIKAN